MAKVIAVGRYENGPRGLTFAVGDIFEPTPELWAFLQSDAPECFQPHHDAPVVDAPPRDKIVKRNSATRK
jgi:hypothetical protein